jgi:hypothetical protein
MITPSFSLTATERVLPKLALDFTTAVLDSRITFSRTTGASNPATYFNNSGVLTAATNDQPRFDFNPVTLICKGLLIEESRDNLFLQSQALDNATNWATGASSVSANAAISPENINNAFKLISDTNVTTHNLRQGITRASSTVTASIFAKQSEYPKLGIREGAATGGYATFNLSTGAVIGQGSGGSGTITNIGNGWYRCTLTITGTNPRFDFYPLPSAFTSGSPHTYTYAGNGTDGIYLWGAQLEAGAFATSYIPTTTTALTRNADVATITGTNFSSFWQATRGGASVLATPSTVSGIRPLVQFDDNTADNIIALRGNAVNPELQIVDGGAPQVQLDAGTIVANTPYSLTGWWQTNDCKARKDSGAVVTDTTATIPTVTQARIGSDGTNYLNGTIATINYYDSFFGRPIYTRRKNKVFASLL